MTEEDRVRADNFMKALDNLERKYECRVFIGCGCCEGGFYVDKDLVVNIPESIYDRKKYFKDQF